MNRIETSSPIERFGSVMDDNQSPNKAGAGNGARAVSFHFGRLGRAVPDLLRSAAKKQQSQNQTKPYGTD